LVVFQTGFLPGRRRILAGGGRVFMADIDTALGEQSRDKFRADFGQEREIGILLVYQFCKCKNFIPRQGDKRDKNVVFSRYFKNYLDRATNYFKVLMRNSTTHHVEEVLIRTRNNFPLK
jgi:hypothetical protein